MLIFILYLNRCFPNNTKNNLDRAHTKSNKPWLEHYIYIYFFLYNKLNFISENLIPEISGFFLIFKKAILNRSKIIHNINLCGSKTFKTDGRLWKKHRNSRKGHNSHFTFTPKGNESSFLLSSSTEAYQAKKKKKKSTEAYLCKVKAPNETDITKSRTTPPCVDWNRRGFFVFVMLCSVLVSI